MTRTFARIATAAAALAALAGLAYTVSFAAYVQKGYHWAQWASSVALVVGALALLVAGVGAYRHFRGDEPDLATVAFLLAEFGAFASALHAIYDIALLAKPDAGGIGGPFPVDPRGFGTFALSGCGLALFGWLGGRTGALPSAVRMVALVAGACMVVVFVGRLAILNPKSNAVKPFALAAGLVLTPATLIGFARSFSRSS
jgi:hypothetical protein